MKDVPRHRCSLSVAVAIAISLPALPLRATAGPTNSGFPPAYGVVQRIQSATSRVIVQPLEGKFLEGEPVELFEPGGGSLGTGTARSVYADVVYLEVEDADRLSAIRPGFGAAQRGTPSGMLEVLRDRTSLEARERERDWDRHNGTVMELDADTMDPLVQKGKLPVLVTFYVDWCPHCRSFNPVLAEVAKELEEKMRVGRVHSERQKPLAKSYDVKSYPTVMLFRDGKIVDRWSGGYTSKEPVLKRVRGALGAQPDTARGK